MKTITQIVEDQITTLPELQEALLLAIQLEFSTIPLYLFAQWSIQENDPNGVVGMIQGVVVQEMLHFGLACNMYTATGGSLTGQIATQNIIPDYGNTGLPGGIHAGLIVSLLPVGPPALSQFMSIEYPDIPPVVPAPASPPAPPAPPAPPGTTIGQFYTTIAAGFNTVFVGTPQNPPTAQWPTSPPQYQVTATEGDTFSLFAITSVGDALTAIAEITDQGEGTTVSPDEGTFDPTDLAHYYTFAEIYYGNQVLQSGSAYTYTGDAIQMPTPYTFVSEAPNAPDQESFISFFTTLLQNLEACWTQNTGNINTAIYGPMKELQRAAATLFQAGHAPQFIFNPPS